MSKSTKTRPGPITVDTQLPEVIMNAAAARVKLIRKRQFEEEGVSRLTLSDVCRDILLGWTEGQTEPRPTPELPSLVKCTHCGVMVGLYENGKLRAHGPVKRRCPASYYNPAVQRLEPTLVHETVTLPKALRKAAASVPLPTDAACPQCGQDVPVNKDGKLRSHGARTCSDWFIQVVPVSTTRKPGGEDDKKMRFPMNRLKYEAIRERIEATGQSVAWVLEKRLEHFAKTGQVSG